VVFAHPPGSCGALPGELPGIDTALPVTIVNYHLLCGQRSNAFAAAQLLEGSGHDASNSSKGFPEGGILPTRVELPLTPAVASGRNIRLARFGQTESPEGTQQDEIMRRQAYGYIAS
jgi:hypothetical protein